ncbi:MAG: META domain-containing protein [Bacteroidota bacterium]
MQKISFFKDLLLIFSLLTILIACKKEFSDNLQVKNYLTKEKTLQHQLLNDIWVLESTSDTPIDIQLYNPSQLPNLEFQLVSSKVFGHTGCNSLHGEFEIGNGNMLSIQNIITTKKACSQLMKLEHEFLNQLYSCKSYEINEGKLSLYNGTEKTLIFKKVD